MMWSTGMRSPVRFRDGEKRRQAPLDEINTARARLEQERKGLLEQGDSRQRPAARN